MTDHCSNPKGTDWSEFECQLLGQFDLLKEKETQKELKSLLIGWNERCEVAQAEELILLGLKVTSSNPFEASLFKDEPRSR